MLLGSRLSGWDTVCDTNGRLPFDIVQEKNGRKWQSLWCKPTRIVFENEKSASLLEAIVADMRVEKYSFLNMLDFQEVVGKSIMELQNQYKRMIDPDNALTLQERKNLKYNLYMSESGIENYILIDMIFGISFAEVCYMHLKKVYTTFKKRDWEPIDRIIGCLSQIKCCSLRNKLTELIMQYLTNTIVARKELEEFIMILQVVVKIVNTAYMVSLYQIYLHIREIDESHKEKLWRQEVLNAPINKFDNPYYKHEIYMDICKEKGIVHKPVLAENVCGEEQQKPTWKLYREIDNFLNYYSISADVDIDKMNKERREEQDKRSGFKIVKTENELYIKIQYMAFMQYPGNFPSLVG